MSEENKKEPLIINETAGVKKYCRCKQTSTPPYCDGSHEGSGIEPCEVTIEEDKQVQICTCGFSANHPFCDGSHMNC